MFRWYVNTFLFFNSVILAHHHEHIDNKVEVDLISFVSPSCNDSTPYVYIPLVLTDDDMPRRFGLVHGTQSKSIF